MAIAYRVPEKTHDENVAHLTFDAKNISLCDLLSLKEGSVKKMSEKKKVKKKKNKIILPGWYG